MPHYLISHIFILIKNVGFSNALTNSYKIFNKNKSTLVGIYLVLGLVSLGIICLFLIPLGILIYFMILNYSSTNFLTLIMSNLIPLAISLFIGFIGFAILQVFYIKAQTEFYLELVKLKSTTQFK
jgi:hypothetical protein